MKKSEPPEFLWVFSGVGGIFPAALFLDKEVAEEWIRAHFLSGTLTLYPVDQSAYDWAISKGHFTPKKPHETSAEFIQCFSSGSQEHFHYNEGMLDV